jgi:haloalkane dehalogenase
MNTTINISSAFPYQSKYLEVFGSKIHYIDEGEGNPIVFLHGIPTSSYLWRNIIPYLSGSARCIVPDLIGMGKSGKPDIEYRIFDHIRYIEAFINQLNLKNITFLLHDWGSVIGFDYAMRNKNKVKGLAFLEAHIRPVMDWSMVSLPVQELSTILHTPDGGYDVIMNSNYFVNKVLPHGCLRKLSDEEMKHYREPFDTPESCKPLWQYLQDLPLGDGPKDVVELITNYSQQLQKSQIPKLMMYAVPGFITTISTVQWARQHLPNLSLVDIGDALHYAQETNPDTIGMELKNWFLDSVQSKERMTTSDSA